MINLNYSGIYCIKNIKNNKIYIGSALNIRTRWNSHKHYLNGNKHHSKPLQFAWNKYGEENFKFEIIQIIKNKELLVEYEQFYLDLLQPYYREIGYNILFIADSPLGRKCKQKSKNKMRIARLGRKFGPLSEEHKEKISIAVSGEKNGHFGKPAWNKGIPWDNDVKLKLSVSSKGRFVGEKSPNAKINWEFVNYIRKLYCETKLNCKDLSNHFNNISYSTIVKIISNDYWKDKNYIKPNKKYVCKEKTKQILKEKRKLQTTTEQTKLKLSEKFSGEKNPAAKLNYNKVNEIREKYKTNKYSFKELSNEYNVSQTIIYKIIHNKLWKVK